MNYTDHFRLLRLARLRRLQWREVGESILVSSHSQPNRWHKVSAGICSCPAIGPCSHLALADSILLTRSNPIEYHEAMSQDANDLWLRLYRDEASREDVKFQRWAYLAFITHHDGPRGWRIVGPVAAKRVRLSATAEARIPEREGREAA